MSDSVWPHRRQPTRRPRPWDSPGKNTGVGCHFLLQCMKVKSEKWKVKSWLTLSDPMDCSPPGSSVHGIFQVRVLGGVPVPSLLAIMKNKQRNPKVSNTHKKISTVHYGKLYHINTFLFHPLLFFSLSFYCIVLVLFFYFSDCILLSFHFLIKLAP